VSRRGFTLLEVMVALAILAMSLVAAFDVVGGALRNHERTRHLELATLLARSKLADVEAKYEEDGFRDFDESDDGTFDEEGHPEVSWSVRTLKPTVELGAEGVVKALTGADGGLEGLLGLPAGSLGGKAGDGKGASGPTTSAMAGLQGAGGLAGGLGATAALGAIQAQLTALGEEIKKGVREVRLTVSWKEGAREEAFTVVTHLVVLVPGSQQPAAAAAAGSAAVTGGAGGLTGPAGGQIGPGASGPAFDAAAWSRGSAKVNATRDNTRNRGGSDQ
jgi:general secretion pathway protein I